MEVRDSLFRVSAGIAERFFGTFGGKQYASDSFARNPTNQSLIEAYNLIKNHTHVIKCDTKSQKI